MATPSQALAEVHEERLKRDAEAARWARYRKEANPPAWIVAVVVVAAIGGMVALAAFLLQNPDAFREPFGLLVLPGCGILWIASRLAGRRERTLLRIIQEESPALYDKLKDESLVR